MEMIDKFLDWYFSGKFLRNNIVLAIIGYVIGYLIGKS
jgi:hypothetical protein